MEHEERLMIARRLVSSDLLAKVREVLAEHAPVRVIAAIAVVLEEHVAEAPRNVYAAGYQATADEMYAAAVNRDRFPIV